MIRLLLLVLLLVPCAARAQAPTLRISAAGRSVEAAAARHRGYVAHAAATLQALGAQLELQPWGAVVVLFGDTLRFETLSPFFRAGGQVAQLVAPAYSEDGALYLPHQFFVEWLPARYPDRIRYDAGQLARIAGAPDVSPGRDAVVTPGRGADFSPVVEPVDAGSGAAASPAPARHTPEPTQDARGPGPEAEPPAAGAELPQRVVIIDAGHGGPDPGRIGPDGVREEDVALVISRRLAALLREKDGYEVHLTRTTDTLIALDDRPRMANEWKAGRPAALFLSIHANAFSAGVQGFETFFLSDARTEDERRVAEMENAAVSYEENGSAEPADDLEHILNTLRNNFYIHASNDLAELIQAELEAFHPGPNRGVKQAGFRVLVGAFMPAVLVETAFISNPEEARLLATAAFQQKIAWGLAEAIERFFTTHEHLWAVDDDG